MCPISYVGIQLQFFAQCNGQVISKWDRRPFWPLPHPSLRWSDGQSHLGCVSVRAWLVVAERASQYSVRVASQLSFSSENDYFGLQTPTSNQHGMQECIASFGNESVMASHYRGEAIPGISFAMSGSCYRCFQNNLLKSNRSLLIYEWVVVMNNT
jgi:hypothetical protein